MLIGTALLCGLFLFCGIFTYIASLHVEDISSSLMVMTTAAFTIVTSSIFLYLMWSGKWSM